jgi:hypothetical protein
MYLVFFMTALSLIMLTLCYAFKYYRFGVGSGLSYWFIIYIGFAFILLGTGLLQMQAGCVYIIDDCYSKKLPYWVSDLKLIWTLSLILFNTIAIIFSLAIFFRKFK